MLVKGGRIVAARVLLDGVTPAGAVLEARLASIGQNSRNAVARLADGSEVLLPRRPDGISEGATLAIEISREAIPGTEPWKRPIGRATDLPLRSAGIDGRSLVFPPAGRDELDEAGWSDLLDEAASGIVRFAGGELRISPTPAMTLIDVDGHLPPGQLAQAGAAAAGAAIIRLGIGGSIGIDLPTVQGKAVRQAAAEALDRALGSAPFERTAINGFGFVQLVRPRHHASLVELYAGDRAAAEARALLRRAGKLSGPIRLAAHPAVIAILELQAGWRDTLARQVGGAVSLRSDLSLAMSGGHAEAA